MEEKIIDNCIAGLTIVITILVISISLIAVGVITYDIDPDKVISENKTMEEQII